MKNYWQIVKRVINESNVILEIIDARFPDETRNKNIERLANERKKPLIYVFNKADLINYKETEKKVSDLKPHVFVSAKKNLGTTILRRMIKNSVKKPIKVGVVGYPNTGKSSIINVLKQKRSARTSPVPGFTKGMQLIKVEEGFYILDTPGVIPLSMKEESKRALLSVVSAHNLEDPESAAYEIIEKFKESNKIAFEKHYGVSLNKGSEEILEELAKIQGRLKKGGIPNVKEAAVMLIDDWQRGRIVL